MQHLLEEGSAIRDGSYVIERFVGEGAFAEVYRVNHRILGRQALKAFKNPGEQDEFAEAITLSRMGHRNIVRVFDAGTLETTQGPRGYLTMEYIAGGSLQQFWQSFGNDLMPVEKAVDIIRQVCAGLSLAHSDDPPIVHRDIKPQNILVGYDAQGLRACVSDFGLAKRINPLAELLSARGTACFKAPETFLNPMSDSCAGDVWAVGLMLYLLLTDNFPYSGSDLDALDYNSFRQPLRPAASYNIQVDAALEQILQRALAVSREDRYQNALQMFDHLQRWQPQPAPQNIKEAIGDRSSKTPIHLADEQKARQLAAAALKLSRQLTTLQEAADLMEEAFNKWPALRDEYERQIRLWRCGIMM